MDQSQKLQIPTEIRTFLEGLLQDANILNLDDAMREEMIKELYARLDNFMTSKIVDNMPSEFLDEFIKLNEDKKPQAEIETFLKIKIQTSKQVPLQPSSD